METKLIAVHALTGEEVTPGEIIKDFRGDDFVFWSATRAPEEGRTGKVCVIALDKYKGTREGATEYYQSVFSLHVKKVPA
jgi:hypothetical protein